MEVFRKFAPWGVQPTDENLTTFFDSAEATDFTGPANMAKRDKRVLKWYMGRLEAMLPGDGFAVGGRLSLADVMIFNMFGECLSEEQGPGLPSFRREPFASLARTNAALAAHPKIKAIVDNVAGLDAVKHHIATRGKQGF